MTRKRRRLYVVIGGLLVLGTVSALVLTAFSDNLVFFYSLDHVGIYLEPDGILLHQLQGLNSVRETYGGFFQRATRAIARHKDFLEAMPPVHDPKDRSIWTGERAGEEPT